VNLFGLHGAGVRAAPAGTEHNLYVASHASGRCPEALPAPNARGREAKSRRDGSFDGSKEHGEVLSGAISTGGVDVDINPQHRGRTMGTRLASGHPLCATAPAAKDAPIALSARIGPHPSGIVVATVSSTHFWQALRLEAANLITVHELLRQPNDTLV